MPIRVKGRNEVGQRADDGLDFGQIDVQPAHVLRCLAESIGLSVFRAGDNDGADPVDELGGEGRDPRVGLRNLPAVPLQVVDELIHHEIQPRTGPAQ